MIYRKIPYDNSSSFYTEESLDNNFHYLEDRIQFLENRVQYLEHRLHYKSVIRAQRAGGGTSNTPGKWSFTSLSGNATAVWDGNNNGRGPGIIFTFHGFSRFPSQINVLQDGEYYSGSSLLYTVENKLDPNIITSFDPNLHKVFFGAGQFNQEADIYFEIRE